MRLNGVINLVGLGCRRGGEWIRMKVFRKLRQAWRWGYRDNLVVKVRFSGHKPKTWQRAELLGRGRIEFGENVQIGWEQSPSFRTTYGYFEARLPGSLIQVGDECIFNNDAAVISEGESDDGGVVIGKRCLFGVGFRCYDSDFHGLEAKTRNDRKFIKTAPVVIGDDCFFGERCMVLKGVRLGDRCVIGAGSVVTRSFPPDSVIGGNPARLIRSLNGDF